MGEYTNALVSALQGASNAAASNISGPVDLIAWALRKAGVPVPSNPVMGSDWMRQKGLLADPQSKMAGLLGEGLGMAAPAVAAAKAPQIARGLLNVADDFQAYNKALGPAGVSQATVWHGSPHKFDKFDSSKIGTGEGAQAYGHGLYFADNPGVAKSYRDNLSAGNDPRDWISNIASVLGKNKKTSPQDVAAEFRRYGQTAPLADNQDVVTLAKRMADGYEWNPTMGETWTNDAMTAMQRLDAMLPKSPPGSLYKVDLPDPLISRMLDWDKPLSEQSDFVRNALGVKLRDHAAEDALIAKAKQLGVPPTQLPEYAQLENAMDAARPFTNMPGELAYWGAADPMRVFSSKNARSAASAEALRQKGIPGIRYLDGGSRGAGAGTSNYVVFPGEESALTILERNGSPINALVKALQGPR